MRLGICERRSVQSRPPAGIKGPKKVQHHVHHSIPQGFEFEQRGEWRLTINVSGSGRDAQNFTIVLGRPAVFATYSACPPLALPRDALPAGVPIRSPLFSTTANRHSVNEGLNVRR